MFVTKDFLYMLAEKEDIFVEKIKTLFFESSIADRLEVCRLQKQLKVANNRVELSLSQKLRLL